MRKSIGNFSTKADDRLPEEEFTELLSKVIENISRAINIEFTRGTENERLFSMPVLGTLNLLQKSQLARDLIELLINSHKHRVSVNIKDTLGNIRNFKEIKTNTNLIESLKSHQEIHLSEKDADELLALIFTTCSESKSWEITEELNFTQDKYVFISRHLRELLKTQEKKVGGYNKQFLLNKELEKELEVLKVKQQNLEKQLEELNSDHKIMKEKSEEMQLELFESRSLLRQAFTQSGPLKRRESRSLC